MFRLGPEIGQLHYLRPHFLRQGNVHGHIHALAVAEDLLDCIGHAAALCSDVDILHGIVQRLLFLIRGLEIACEHRVPIPHHIGRSCADGQHQYRRHRNGRRPHGSSAAIALFLQLRPDVLLQFRRGLHLIHYLFISLKITHHDSSQLSLSRSRPRFRRIFTLDRDQPSISLISDRLYPS